MGRADVAYRVLILVAAAADVVWVFFREFYWQYFDSDIQRLVGLDGYGATFPWPDYLYYSVLVVSAVSYIGLFLYRRWAAWSLLALNAAVLVVLAPLTGTEIAVPVEKIAKSIVLMADGAILSLAFLSEELRPRFQ